MTDKIFLSNIRVLPKLAIAGLVRNAEKTFVEDFNALQSSFGNLFEVSFVFIESDSKDETLRILEEYALTLDNFVYVSLGNLEVRVPNRIDRISFCRNIYLEKLRELNYEMKFDYVAVADMDGINNCLSLRSVASIFDRKDWDMCAANQKPRYYDIYALRKESWCTENCFEIMEKRIGNGENPFKVYKEEIIDKQISIPTDTDWIPVQSAFGGLAVYKSEAFFSSEYSPTLKGETLCEHVPFHQKMITKGYKLFINPSLINSCHNPHLNEHKFTRKIRRWFLIWVYDVVGNVMFNRIKDRLIHLFKKK